MSKVYIAGGARSYIGVENGMYRHVPAECLGAKVLGRVVQPYKEDLDLVIGGNAVGAGGNVTRLMMLTAGLPETIPAFTIDLQCGSGLESIAVAAAKIRSGQAQVVAAGGFDSSSTAPRRGYHKNHPDYEKYGGNDFWYSVAKFAPGEHNEAAMLEGADRVARKEGIGRRDMDAFVLRSHKLAKEARESGILNDILVEVVEGKCADEGIRDRMSQKLLDRLPAILPDSPVLTAANTCLVNDGAAFLILCSEEYLNEHGLTAWAEFVDAAEIGANPEESPRTAIMAMEKVLEKNHMRAEDADIIECNEAFAVIDVLFERKYPHLLDRYNLLGGALAYGHPYGASGGMITLHAIKALEKVKGNYAVISIAAAAGMGSAILIKRCDS